MQGARGLCVKAPQFKRWSSKTTSRESRSSSRTVERRLHCRLWEADTKPTRLGRKSSATLASGRAPLFPAEGSNAPPRGTEGGARAHKNEPSPLPAPLLVPHPLTSAGQAPEGWGWGRYYLREPWSGRHRGGSRGAPASPCWLVLLIDLLRSLSLLTPCVHSFRHSPTTRGRASLGSIPLLLG